MRTLRPPQPTARRLPGSTAAVPPTTLRAKLPKILPLLNICKAVLKKLTLAILLPYAAFSQTTPPISNYYVANPTAIRDSLKALPLVRKENQSLRYAVSRYKYSADTARASYLVERGRSVLLRLAWRDQKIITATETVRADHAESKIKHMSFWGWVKAGLFAGVGAGVGFAIGAASR